MVLHQLLSLQRSFFELINAEASHSATSERKQRVLESQSIYKSFATWLFIAAAMPAPPEAVVAKLEQDIFSK